MKYSKNNILEFRPCTSSTVDCSMKNKKREKPQLQEYEIIPMTKENMDEYVKHYRPQQPEPLYYSSYDYETDNNYRIHHKINYDTKNDDYEIPPVTIYDKYGRKHLIQLRQGANLSDR